MGDAIVRRYTTPMLRIVCEGVDLTGARVWVSFADGTRRNRPTRTHAAVTVDSKDGRIQSEVDGSNTILTLTLTQEETARLGEGYATAQVNCITAGGARDASDEISVWIGPNMLEEVVGYGG